MITLDTLTRRRDAKRKPKRIGRGSGSGLGGHSSTRGTKGQKSRKGANIHPSFEGGQMPLQRRLPKRGFTNPFREDFQIINLDKLVDFPKGTTVDAKILKEHNIISNAKKKVKLIGNDEIKQSLIVKGKVLRVSASKKIECVGGEIEVL